MVKKIFHFLKDLEFYIIIELLNFIYQYNFEAFFQKKL
jgi:hypothetical protein